MDDHTSRCTRIHLKPERNTPVRSIPSASAHHAQMGYRKPTAPRSVVHAVAPVAPETTPDTAPQLTLRDTIRAVVSTDTEFFSNSRYLTRGEWSGCWCTHWRTVNRGKRGILPERRNYFKLLYLDGMRFETITDTFCASLDQLLPPATRSVWLTVIGQAVAKSHRNRCGLFSCRIKYKQVYEGLIQREVSHAVPAEWCAFIDQQLEYLSHIYYQLVATTGNGTRTVDITQSAPLPLVAVSRQSNKPHEFKLVAVSPLFWILFGIGRTRVLPCQVQFPTEVWRYCACCDLLSRISSTKVSGSVKISDLFCPTAKNREVRDHYAQADKCFHVPRDSRSLAVAVRSMLASLTALGALSWSEPEPLCFKWTRKDHGKTLSDGGLFAECLARSFGQSAVEGSLWGHFTK